jgi:hypothetical protein
VRTILLFLFAGCTFAAKGTLGSSSSPSSSPPSGVTAPTSLGDITHPGPAWARASDDYANGLGTEGDGERWDTAFTHKDVEKAFGHHIHVAWDWPSFEGHDFKGTTPQAPGRMCVGEVLFRIAVMCGNEQSASVRPINTVTCRYKACTELPPLAWTRNDGILDPGYEYALTSNGTNLDVTFCDKSSTTGTFDLYVWIANPTIRS